MLRCFMHLIILERLAPNLFIYCFHFSSCCCQTSLSASLYKDPAKMFMRFLFLLIKILLSQLHPLPAQVIELSPYFLPGFITQNRRG